LPKRICSASRLVSFSETGFVVCFPHIGYNLGIPYCQQYSPFHSLVSYAAWDTQNDPASLRRALNFIARHAPDSEPFGAKNVYVGEFGKPENEFTRQVVERSVSRTFSTAYRWGCPYVVFWQVYCNEAKKPIVEGNDDVKGFWLIRPDGTRGWACDVLRGILAADGPR